MSLRKIPLALAALRASALLGALGAALAEAVPGAPGRDLREQLVDRVVAGCNPIDDWIGGDAEARALLGALETLPDADELVVELGDEAAAALFARRARAR